MCTWKPSKLNVFFPSWRTKFPLTKCRPSIQRVFIILTILIIVYFWAAWPCYRMAQITSSVCREPVVRELSISKHFRTVRANNYTLAVRQAMMRIKNNPDSLNPNVVSPFLSVTGIHRIAPKYNLAACINEKVMCTLTQAIFCYLYDSDCFLASNRSLTKESWDGRFCENRNEFIGSRKNHGEALQNIPTLFMVRDPVEKFLSAYSNKCLLEDATGDVSCFDCQNGDVLCAVERFHSEIMEYAVRNSFYQNNFYNSLDWRFWPQFSMLTSHALPSIWRCELFDEFNNYYFIKYGETADQESQMWHELLSLFWAHGVEGNKLAYISNSVRKRSRLATKHRKERIEVSKILRNSPKHMQFLREVYYYDSIIFGYPLP